MVCGLDARAKNLLALASKPRTIVYEGCICFYVKNKKGHISGDSNYIGTVGKEHFSFFVTKIWVDFNIDNKTRIFTKPTCWVQFTPMGMVSAIFPKKP